jgi:hypothetical protein
MSYVGAPFTHDILITYGVEPGTPTKLQEWSLGFSSELESELRFFPKFSHKVKILTDESFRSAGDPNGSLPRELDTAIGTTALFVALMSPAYLRSGWCTRVRESWFRAQRELGWPIDGRIAVIRVMPTEEPWPDGFVDARGQELVGFRFYEPSDGVTRPFDWPKPSPQSRDPFRRELITLVGRLAEKLEQLHVRLSSDRTNDVRQIECGRGGTAASVPVDSRRPPGWEPGVTPLLAPRSVLN